MMRKFFNKKNGAALLGAILVTWSITSAFAHPLKPRPAENPLDRLDDPGLSTVVPTLVAPPATPLPSPTLILPLASPPAPTPNTGDPLYPFDNGFFVPVTPQPTLALPAEVVSQATPPALPTPSIVPQETPTPPGSENPSPQPLVPDRILIPAIGLDAPVVPSAYREIEIDGMLFQQWLAPKKFAAGWQSSSAPLGIPGNTILDGHHNVYGEVFGRLKDLLPGDLIHIFSGDTLIEYQVTNHMILLEKDQPLSVRLDNASWLQPTTDERLTLVTCWPPESNTHRVFVIARPLHTP